jgi:hypothetical protein
MSILDDYNNEINLLLQLHFVIINMSIRKQPYLGYTTEFSAGNTPDIHMFGSTRTSDEWYKLCSRPNNKFNKASNEVGKSAQEIYKNRIKNYLDKK